MGSIPNMRHWPVLKALVWHQEWEYQDEGILDRTHLRFYTIKSFPRLLQRCGYRVERFEGINRNVPRKTARWLSLILGVQAAADVLYMQFAFVASADAEAGGARA
jgi:hypothetical protein